jgi:hypothetical protein
MGLETSSVTPDEYQSLCDDALLHVTDLRKRMPADCCFFCGATSVVIKSCDKHNDALIGWCDEHFVLFVAAKTIVDMQVHYSDEEDLQEA